MVASVAAIVSLSLFTSVGRELSVCAVYNSELNKVLMQDGVAKKSAIVLQPISASLGDEIAQWPWIRVKRLAIPLVSGAWRLGPQQSKDKITFISEAKEVISLSWDNGNDADRHRVASEVQKYFPKEKIAGGSHEVSHGDYVRYLFQKDLSQTCNASQTLDATILDYLSLQTKIRSQLGVFVAGYLDLLPQGTSLVYQSERDREQYFLKHWFYVDNKWMHLSYHLRGKTNVDVEQLLQQLQYMFTTKVSGTEIQGLEAAVSQLSF